EHAHQIDVLDTAAADRPDGVVAEALVDHREAGERIVDDLLEHHVGLVQAALRSSRTGVVDLDDERLAGGDVRVRHGQTCDRVDRNGRGGGGRFGDGGG